MLIGCVNNSNDSATESGHNSTLRQAESSQPEAIVNGNTLTYGNHRYTVEGEINADATVQGRRDKPTAQVSFTNVPSDYDEFQAVYNALLGKSEQGTAAMIPMAIELYARDRDMGEQCLRLLCNSDATVSGITRILNTKLSPAEHAPANDPYLQRYMAAALLKGATPDNAYTPSEPYTVLMCASANKPQNSTAGTVSYLYILADGWDSKQRQVEILRPNNTQLYKVFNCPSTYTQCKNIIGEWKGLK